MNGQCKICGIPVHGVASHLSERMAWQLLRDVAGSDAFPTATPTAFSILWNGERFVLSHGATMVDDAETAHFIAPEGSGSTASHVWSLAATVFYLFMGCHVFNGLGGKAQHEKSPLPYIRKSLPELSEFIMQCLHFDPSQRPDAGKVAEYATAQLKRIASTNMERPKKTMNGIANPRSADDFWPEEM